MDRNPYAPPVGNVDAVEVPDRRERPWQIKAALSLLGLALVLSVPQVVYEFMYRRSPFYSRAHEIVSMSIGLVVMLGLASLVSASIWKGWRWGRILYAVIAGLGTISAFEAIPRWFGRAVYLGVSDLLGTAADIAAVVLLFTAAGNEWFRRRSR